MCQRWNTVSFAAYCPPLPWRRVARWQEEEKEWRRTVASRRSDGERCPARVSSGYREVRAIDFRVFSIREESFEGSTLLFETTPPSKRIYFFFFFSFFQIQFLFGCNLLGASAGSLIDFESYS